MPGGKGDHGPRGGMPAADAAAKALGLTVEELRTELQSGKSIADVAKAKNVDIEKVKTAMLEAFTAKEQAEVASGEHTQAEVDAKIAEFKTRLDDIVNGVKPAGMPGGKGDHGPRGGAPFGGEAVATALGITVATAHRAAVGQVDRRCCQGEERRHREGEDRDARGVHRQRAGRGRIG